MPHYFDSAQQRDIQALSRTFIGRTQWPTWLLLTAVPCAWFALMLGSSVIGAGWTIVLLVPVVVLWMSVQHELLHGHPTRWKNVNKVLGYAPFALWYPYICTSRLNGCAKPPRNGWHAFLSYCRLSAVMPPRCSCWNCSKRQSCCWPRPVVTR